MTSEGDPLNLSAEQRAASDAAQYMDDLLSGRIYDRNVQAIKDLPEGGMVKVGYVTYTREQLLARLGEA